MADNRESMVFCTSRSKMGGVGESTTTKKSTQQILYYLTLTHIFNINTCRQESAIGHTTNNQNNAGGIVPDAGGNKTYGIIISPTF
jgi:hypothetical protein